MARIRVAVSLALAAFTSFAAFAADPSAQGWADRPIRFVVPYPAGSSPDLIARMLHEPLGRALGRPVVVDNRPGAGGNIGTALVARAQPDGHTIGLSIPGPLAVNTKLYRRLDYDPFTELAPVTMLAVSPNVLVVEPKSGMASMADFVRAAKAKPAGLNYGSIGNGSASHLTMELFKHVAGIDVVHVPYASSPQVNTAIIGGQVQAGFVVPGTVAPFAQAGRIRMLVQTTARRTALLPDLPTVAESGYPGFESTAWNAVVVPAGTPRPLVDRLHAELTRLLGAEELRAKLAALYFEPAPGTPEGLAREMRAELARWGTVIDRTGARVD